MKRILGISAYYHDSAAALLIDGKVMAAVQEERFSRQKHDFSFPSRSIEYCLAEGGLSIDDLDAVVFYDKPFLKFERLLETYYAFVPKGFASFVQSMPRWVGEQLLLKKSIRKSLKEIQSYDGRKLRLLFSEHHLSHAASAFYPSPFEEAAVLTIDGVGEWATSSLGHGKGGQLTLHKELHFPHSLGLLYSAFTYFLGFRVNSGEYKLMGLASYGNDKSERFARYLKLIQEELVDLKEDGSLRLHQRYFTYATKLRMLDERQWQQLFGLPRRPSEQAFGQEHADLALAIQRFTEEVVFRMAREVQALTGSRRLCLAGGVALNCVANGRLLERGLFDEIFVQPAAGDAGGALGAALAVYHLHYGGERVLTNEADSMSGALLGPAYGLPEVERIIRRYDLSAKRFDQFEELAQAVVDRLEEGAIVGWFQGRMEFGPRALGNRSILADPRREDMQRRLNLQIKKRESFRPFAPVVLVEDFEQYFRLPTPSPYMNLVGQVVEDRLASLPEDYSEWPIRQKLDFAKSDVPAVTHVDLTARIQTVKKESNFRLWHLIHTFKQKTGCSLLINTSFNGKDEPIVCSPDDAASCFLQTGMDILVLGDHLCTKKGDKEGR
ncbi:MAG: carbamoyltransferase [Bacteroidota bacterium]